MRDISWFVNQFTYYFFYKILLVELKSILRIPLTYWQLHKIYVCVSLARTFWFFPKIKYPEQNRYRPLLFHALWEFFSKYRDIFLFKNPSFPREKKSGNTDVCIHKRFYIDIFIELTMIFKKSNIVQS